MSKQLIKIIVICSLVILCPLVIVGVALMSTEAVGCTLTIYDSGIEKLGETDFGGKSSKVTIMVNGKAQDSNKIELTKRDEVTVTYEGVGYDFIGWYNGNYNEINFDSDVVVSDQVSYTFEISKDTVLTAVRNVKSYNVTFAGNYDDETTAMDAESKTYEYNEPLATPSAKSTKNVLAGWYEMVQGSAGITTKVANFEKSGDVTIYPKWESQYTFNFSGIATYVLDSINMKGNWAVTGTKNNVEGKDVYEENTLMYFMENPTPGYYDLNQDVCEYFLSAYSNFKTLNGDDARFTNKVQILFEIDGVSNADFVTVDLTLQEDNKLTFKQVLDSVQSKISLSLVDKINLNFVFEEVVA